MKEDVERVVEENIPQNNVTFVKFAIFLDRFPDNELMWLWASVDLEMGRRGLDKLKR